MFICTRFHSCSTPLSFPSHSDKSTHWQRCILACHMHIFKSLKAVSDFLSLFLWDLAPWLLSVFCYVIGVMCSQRYYRYTIVWGYKQYLCCSLAKLMFLQFAIRNPWFCITALCKYTSWLCCVWRITIGYFDILYISGLTVCCRPLECQLPWLLLPVEVGCLLQQQLTWL